MRLRLLIPAALAAAVTYAALVRDEPAAAPVWAPFDRPPDPPAPPRPVPAPEEPLAAVISIVPMPEPPQAPEVAPVAWADSPYADLAEAARETELTSVYEMLAGAAPHEAPEVAAPVSDAPPAVADEPVAPLDEGRFALGGWAAAPGHSVVSAITFRRRLRANVPPDRIVLDVDAAENVADGGVEIMTDPGFAPDRDGCTLRLTAADAGEFSAAGTYRVLPG